MGVVALGGRGVGGGLLLLDEVDEGEAALPDLADDAEAALVDPDVGAARRGAVDGVEPREGAAHPLDLASSSAPAISHAARPVMRLARWFGRSASATSTRTVTSGSCFLYNNLNPMRRTERACLFRSLFKK